MLASSKQKYIQVRPIYSLKRVHEFVSVCRRERNIKAIPTGKMLQTWTALNASDQNPFFPPLPSHHFQNPPLIVILTSCGRLHHVWIELLLVFKWSSLFYRIEEEKSGKHQFTYSLCVFYDRQFQSISVQF